MLDASVARCGPLLITTKTRSCQRWLLGRIACLLRDGSGCGTRRCFAWQHLPVNETHKIAILYFEITSPPARRSVRVLYKSLQDATLPQAAFARIGPAPLAALQRLSLAQLGVNNRHQRTRYIADCVGCRICYGSPRRKYGCVGKGRWCRSRSDESRRTGEVGGSRLQYPSEYDCCGDYRSVAPPKKGFIAPRRRCP